VARSRQRSAEPRSSRRVVCGLGQVYITARSWAKLVFLGVGDVAVPVGAGARGVGAKAAPR
jgi:hypothetical protein